MLTAERLWPGFYTNAEANAGLMSIMLAGAPVLEKKPASNPKHTAPV